MMADGYSSGEDSRGALSNPFGILSAANPAKRIKVDAETTSIQAAPHVLAEVCIPVMTLRSKLTQLN